MATKVDYFSNESLSMDLKGTTVRGSAATMVSQAARFLLNLCSTMVLARILLPDDYGLVAMVTVVSGFASLFKDMGLSMATVQRADINHEQISTLFWINLGVCLVLGAILASLAVPIAWFYGESKLVAITLFYALSFPLNGVGLQHLALLRRKMKFTSLAMIDIVSMFCGVVTGIVLALLGRYYWPDSNYFSLVFMQLTTITVSSAAAWIICPWRPGAPQRRTGVRPMVWFGANLTGTNFINYIGRNLDTLLIGKFFGPSLLGVYNRGYSLLVLPQRQCLAPLGNAVIPALSRIHSDKTRFCRAFYSIYENVALFTVPLVVALICTADWLVRVVLGPDWSEAAVYFAALGPVAVTQAVGTACNWAFVASGKTSELLRLSLVNNVLIITSILAGVYWGPLALALAYSLSGVFIRTPLLYWWVARATPVQTSQLYRLAIPFLVAGFVESIVALAMRPFLHSYNPLIALCVVGAASLLSYAAALAVFSHGRRAMRDAILLSRHLFDRFHAV